MCLFFWIIWDSIGLTNLFWFWEVTSYKFHSFWGKCSERCLVWCISGSLMYTQRASFLCLWHTYTWTLFDAELWEQGLLPINGIPCTCKLQLIFGQHLCIKGDLGQKSINLEAAPYNCRAQDDSLTKTTPWCIFHDSHIRYLSGLEGQRVDLTTTIVCFICLFHVE